MSTSLPSNVPADFAPAFQHLLACDRLEVDDRKLMVPLEAAGNPLYQKLAELAPNDEAAELLRQNGREETRRGQRVSRVIEILKAS